MGSPRCTSTLLVEDVGGASLTRLSSPSLHNSLGFVERARVESGLMIGPRIFQTGQIIYGASDYSYHLDIATTREAKEALTRIKAEGGPASWSYKNYNLPARASRQRLLLQARKMNMACVPEGVSTYPTKLSNATNQSNWLGHEFRLGPNIYCRW